MAMPSLCIPRVFKNITRERIAFVFNSLGLGEIDHIDLVQKTTESGQEFQRVFVHFKQWYITDEALRARKAIMAGKEIKIVYDDPWFWKVSMNRSVVRPKMPAAAAVAGGGGAPRRRIRVPPRMEITAENSDQDEALLVQKASKPAPLSLPAAGVFAVPTTPRDAPPDEVDALEVPATPRKLSYQDDEAEQEEAGVALNYEGVNMKAPAKRVRVQKKLSVPPTTLQRLSSQFEPDYELGC
uniref:RRM domain-containing protein n=1 Tax=viral metagenome TaxID=1070528 RepID=A0A6C0B0J4_9ZZZZ